MRVVRLLSALVLILVLSSCASVGKKFTSGTKANMGFFADQTIAMLSEVDLSLQRDDTIFTRRFFNDDEPEEQQAALFDQGMNTMLINIVDYSIALVNISDSQKAMPDKVSDYADLLMRFKEDILYDVDMSSERFDATVEAVRKSPDLLSALSTAQPMITAAVIHAIRELNEVNTAIKLLANKIDTKIDVEYADVIRFQKKIEFEKAQILGAFEIIYDAYRTDNPDLSGLSESGAIWLPDIIPQGRPSKQDLKAIAEHLKARLDNIHTIQQEIKPYWEEYRASHKELDQLTDRTVERINRVRLILVIWGRAHQKMASGVVDPAEWFDIKDAPAILFKLGIDVI